MTKKKETLPKGVLAQNEFTEEKTAEQITQVSLRLDFKARDFSCDAESIATEAVDIFVDKFYDKCVWARAQVLEYKEV